MGGETITQNTPDVDTESSVSTGNAARTLAGPLALVLLVSGMVLALGAPPVQAHGSDTLPTQGGETDGHNVDDDGFWNVVDGFATKTGFRLVFHWDVDEPIAGTVEWGYSPDALDNIARPQGGVVDTAQVAFSDIPREDVGNEIYFRVVDGLEGHASEVHSFTAEDAGTDEQTVPITIADVDRAARASNGLDYPTIQQALDAVPEDGIVWVEPGDHEEDLTLAKPGVRPAAPLVRRQMDEGAAE